MKFKIYKETVVKKTNIFGKPIEIATRCYIYRSMFFDLIKIFLSFIEDWDVRDRYNTWFVVRYVQQESATEFSEQEAEKMLNAIYSHPDKFIRKN